MHGGAYVACESRCDAHFCAYTPLTPIEDSLRVEALDPGVAMKMPMDRAPEQCHPEFFRQIVAHGGYAVTRYDDRNPAQRGLDDHLAGEPPGGKQDLVAAIDAVQGHPATDRIERIVPSDILDRHQQMLILKQRAAVHRSCVAVDAVVLAHDVENAAQSILPDTRLRNCRQPDRVELRHQAGDDGPLPAAAADD